MSEEYLISLSSIIILGIGAQWLAWRLHLPSILLLLIFGFIAGPLLNFLQPDELMGNMLLPFVSIAVSIILFEGGLTLRIKELPHIGNFLILLLTVGVLITWIVGALSAHFIIGLNFPISVLLGAVLVVTGPTVIGPLLRHIRPTGKVADILKWEGIVIDPIGALLALLVFEAILVGGFEEASIVVLASLGETILYGSVVGIVFAILLIILFKKFWVPDFLQETVTLSLVVAAFITSDYLQSESGMFATTLMGLVLANQKKVTVKHILVFKENLVVLIISILFIILSARLDLEVFQSLPLSAFIFLAVMIFVARPLSVFISSIGSSLTFKEKAFLSGMAPRGIVAAAVSSIFALRLTEENIPQTELLVPITFIVIVGTVTLYGLTSAPLAKILKVSQSNPQGVLFIGIHPWAVEIAKALITNGYKVAAIDTNRLDITNAKMVHIPAYHGSVLSEIVIDELKLDGIGRVLAITSNDEANSLACLHMGEIFSRRELYQLQPTIKTKKGIDQPFSPQHLRGRYLFEDGISFSNLSDRFSSGSVVKTIKLTREFTYDSFRELYGDDAIILFVISETKELSVSTTDIKLKPTPGQTIIALVKNLQQNN